MAHKKAAGSAKNLRDSNANYLGLKLNGGQAARAGNIIIRQQWWKYKAGAGAYTSKDFTIHARIDGIVSFRKKAFVRFDGRKYERTVVEVLPAGETQELRIKKQDSVLSAKKTSKKAEAKKDAVKPAKKESAKDSKKDSGADDLTKIEGIGPKIATVFADNGIKSFEDLSASKVGDLRTILADNGLSQHDPKTWKKQATLAKNGKWDELKTLQDELDGGK